MVIDYVIMILTKCFVIDYVIPLLNIVECKEGLQEECFSQFVIVFHFLKKVGQ